MLKIGLTGNIGSGKTFVAQVFSSLGIPVFHADTEARKLYANELFQQKIRELFGESVFLTSGEISRQALAGIVFNDSSRLEQLNQLIHPLVRQQYKAWLDHQEKVPYTLYEAAILFESGYYTEIDKVICVTAPEELRIRRVMERDKVTREEVINRIANQWPEEKKAEIADFLIINDGIEAIDKQVLEIHKKLIGQLDSWK